MDMQHYLHTTETDVINPLRLDNLEEGAKLLISHISQEHNIFIQVDCDCDGYTSAALLINYLYSLFPAFCKKHLTYRLHEQKIHGIILDTIPDNTHLVIAPDSSSNQNIEHKALKDKGIDVLVIDHHISEEEEKSVGCIVNNQMCDYPNKTLSGVGVVYKFCSYIDSLLNINQADKYLDLVALGVIADVMYLTDYETRYLIDKGLKNVNNPYFYEMALKQDYSLQGKRTPTGVAFYIAPGINATTRVGTYTEKLTLFESFLDHKAYEQVPSTKRGEKGQFESRVTQACRNSVNIRNRQNNSRDANLEAIDSLIQQQGLLDNKLLIICLNENLSIDKNLTGLVANQIMGKYKRPVLVLNKYEIPIEDSDKTEIVWSGSGRNVESRDLPDLRKFLLKSGLVEFAQGHEGAFGVSVKEANVEPLLQYANEQLKSIEFNQVYEPDVIFQGDNFSYKEIEEVAELEWVWGHGVEEPFLVFENVRVNKDNLSLLKGTTLKLSINGIDFIKFKSSSEEYENLNSELGYTIINIVGRCNMNVWGGMATPQVFIEDYEIVRKFNYNF